jgi:glyoxalase family protein
MRPPILGLHHVTATVAEAQADVDFASGALGLRLVKRTVNFDNHNVYHFYYGDETGRPSTLWTTFPYKGWGVPQGVHGAGQIVATSFSVPESAIGFWESRLRARGVVQEGAESRFDQEALAYRDPSGLKIELLTSDRDDRAAWSQGGIPTDRAIRGLHSVTLLIRNPARTVELLTDLLGFEKVNEAAGRIRMGVNGAGPGKSIDIVAAPDAPAAANGLGTVHHVALAIADPDQQLQLREEIVRRGLQVTEVRDRCYFTSIYFREPGGVLFEVATVGPGFTLDEEPRRLGESLMLPPWEEPNRSAIESKLPPITVRGA